MTSKKLDCHQLSNNFLAKFCFFKLDIGSLTVLLINLVLLEQQKLICGNDTSVILLQLHK